MRKNSFHLQVLTMVLWLMITMTCFVHAEGFTYMTEAEQIDFAKSNLTEVYGYAYSETENFVFSSTQQDGIATMAFWHKDHPEWVYTCTFSLTDGKRLESKTPFGSGYVRYPGENSVRAVITEITSRGLLKNWDKGAREAFAELVDTWAIHSTSDLEKGLVSATYTPQHALRDFFLSCYGEEDTWPTAVTEWFHILLVENNLPAPEEAAAMDGVMRYRMEGEWPHTITEFRNTFPPEIAKALKHPALEGWQVISGAMVEYDAAPQDDSMRNSPVNNGLIAFAKEDSRMLCMLIKNESEDWRVEPIGESTLLPGRNPSITCEAEALRLARFAIRYDGDGKNEISLTARIMSTQNQLYSCRWENYHEKDVATGDIYQAEAVFYGQVNITHSPAPASDGDASPVSSCSLSFPDNMEYLDLSAFADVVRNSAQDMAYALPEGYMMCKGVHLRQKTSSRSKDLGTFKSGTLIKVLGTEPGDPFPWYHVQIGSLEGYMASNYVSDGSDFSHQYTLPIAMALAKTTLEEHTGWFAPDLLTLNPGETMHVLAEYGNWYYVCVPREGSAGLLMDVDGIYGYVLADQVRIGTTTLGLEWKMAEE